jgi:hypothetical protein
MSGHIPENGPSPASIGRPAAEVNPPAEVKKIKRGLARPAVSAVKPAPVPGGESSPASIGPQPPGVNPPAEEPQAGPETVGVTAEHARAMGVELNILEGQGKAEDYAQYFRDTQLPEEEARQRGLLARSKGQTGFVVGRLASDDVWAAWRGGKFSTEKAAAIADVGRGDEAIQAAGIQRGRARRI